MGKQHLSAAMLLSLVAWMRLLQAAEIVTAVGMLIEAVVTVSRCCCCLDMPMTRH